MSDNDTRLKESLSALMDDAADELEVQRALKAVAEDEELRATWQRYQLARAAMRGEAPAVNMDLSASVAAVIADEPTHNVASGRPAGQLFKTLSRVAIAASVTVVVVLGVQQYNQPGGADSQIIANSSDANSSNESTSLPPVFDAPIQTQTVSDEGETNVKPVFELDEESKRQLEQKLDELIKQNNEAHTLDTNQSE